MKKYILFAKKNYLHYLPGFLLFCMAFIVFWSFTYFQVGGDEISMYYPAKQLLQSNSLNFWNELNEKYKTYYFSLTFSDISMIKWGETFPIQPPLLIFITAFFLSLFGDQGLTIMTVFFSSLSVLHFYLIAERLIKDKLLSFISALVLISMPIFLIWSTITQNISITISFLIMGFYYGVKYIESNNEKKYVYISGFLLALCVWTRLIHLLFLVPFVIFLWSYTKPFKKNTLIISLFLLPTFFVTLLTVGVNAYYFHKPLYVGYLSTNNHPLPPGYSSAAINTISPSFYFIHKINYSLITNSLNFFMQGSQKIYFPLLLFSLLGIFAKKDILLKKFTYFFILSFGIFLFYYAYLEPTLWKDTREEYKWSLVLAFFRYLLPIYIFSLLWLAVFLKNTWTSLKGNIQKLSLLFLFMVYVITMIATTYTYSGGASLSYFKEITDQINTYSKTLVEYLPRKSVILYDDRWPLAYTYPYTMDYYWFYYDGIPPAIRYVHTKEVIDKLLIDGKKVYFVQKDEPYNALSEQMETYLKSHYILHAVPYTEFPRMKTTFYKVEKKTNEN